MCMKVLGVSTCVPAYCCYKAARENCNVQAGVCRYVLVFGG